jgi:hypothetical protein
MMESGKLLVNTVSTHIRLANCGNKHKHFAILDSVKGKENRREPLQVTRRKKHPVKCRVYHLKMSELEREKKKRTGCPLVDANKEKEKRILSPVHDGQEVRPNTGDLPRSDGARTRRDSEVSSASNKTFGVHRNECRFKRTVDGAWRDAFAVEIVTRNGEPFKGSLPPSVGRRAIYLSALKLDPTNLYAAVPGFKGCPIFTFRLKDLIDIDETFFGRESFSFTQQVETEEGFDNIVYE